MPVKSHHAGGLSGATTAVADKNDSITRCCHCRWFGGGIADRREESGHASTTMLAGVPSNTARQPDMARPRHPHQRPQKKTCASPANTAKDRPRHNRFADFQRSSRSKHCSAVLLHQHSLKGYCRNVLLILATNQGIPSGHQRAGLEKWSPQTSGFHFS